MKHIYVLLVSFLLLTNLRAQQTAHLRSTRSQLNPAQYPFYHGVASGDPLTDRVMLWTRITLDPVIDPVSVSWEISADTTFNTIISNGAVITDSTKDYTIKADAAGLQPNTWYYYRFAYDSFKSVIGRTRTLPIGAVNNLRFAIASCQDYQKGFYNAHRQLSERNDIDAVLFLGDYTYENGYDSVIDGRFHEPAHKTVQLIDYRMRQSEYHLDPDLQAAHQQYPWICVWDDHETSNNAYKDGAKSHNTGTDGPWYDRKVNGVETYCQWMPVRMPDASDTFKIFRQFTWGNLADLHMLDTRLYDRDKQVAPTPPQTLVSITDSLILDSTRNMMGPVQLAWLNHNLDSSHAQWQLLGQQVMMAPLVIPGGVFGPDAVMANPDQWDGYPYDRQKIYDHVLSHNIQNMVVLTGDIHTSWANDLPLPNYDTTNRQNSAGVEFVATSISSSNDKLPPLVNEGLIYSLAAYVRYVNLTQHGYYVLDITPARAQADYVFVSNVLTQNYSMVQGPSWYVNSGERFLRQANNPSVALNNYPTLAPNASVSTGIKNISNNITTVMLHPNPFFDELMIQFNVFKSEEVNLELWNTNGELVMQKNLGFVNQGLNHTQFDGSKFPSGYYFIKLRGKTSSVSESVIKIN